MCGCFHKRAKPRGGGRGGLSVIVKSERARARVCTGPLKILSKSLAPASPLLLESLTHRLPSSHTPSSAAHTNGMEIEVFGYSIGLRGHFVGAYMEIERETASTSAPLRCSAPDSLCLVSHLVKVLVKQNFTKEALDEKNHWSCIL